MKEKYCLEMVITKEKLRERERLMKLYNRVENKIEKEKVVFSSLVNELIATLINMDNCQIEALGVLIYRLLEDKYEQKYVICKLKLDQCKALTRRLKDELYEIDSKLFVNSEIEYKKQEYINSINMDFEETYEDVAHISADIKELRELSNIGRNAYSSLKKLLEYFLYIRKWDEENEQDCGVIAKSIKCSHLNDTRDKAIEVIYLLSKFQRELEASEITKKITDDFEKYQQKAEYFTEGYFVEWLLKENINQSIDKLKILKSALKELIEIIKEKQDLYQIKLTEMIKGYNEKKCYGNLEELEN